MLADPFGDHKALANESRLKIVDRLSRGECSVGELTEMIGSDPSTVSKALANESRLKIVDRLSRGECSVGELTEMIGSDPSTVSKHLAVLRVASCSTAARGMSCTTRCSLPA